MPIFNENRKLDLYFIIIAFLATIYFTFVKCTHTRMYILETNDYASNLIRQNLRFIRKFTRSFPGCYRKQSVCSNQPCTESVFFVAEYAQKWEQLLVQQRDIFNAAIDQVSQFRGQLLQEEQISRKMTNS